MHIELICYGSPIKHKKFIEDVNNWEYPLEGNIRKGVYRPFVSEVKFYDIRIKEELAPLFLRDVHAVDFIGMGVHKKKGLREYLILFLSKVMRKLMGSVEVKKAEGKRKYEMPDWFNAFNVACFKDPIQKDSITGEEKEVL